MLKKIKNILKSNKIQSLVGNLTASGFSFISFFILARIISSEKLGIWILFITISGFFDMFRAGLLRVALIRNIYTNENEVTGSTWALAYSITAFQILICLVLKFLFPDFVINSDLDLFVTYFPLLTILNLPYFFTFWIQQAKSRFDYILYVRLVQVVPFAGYLVYSFFFGTDLPSVVIAYISSFGLSATVALAFNWCNPLSIIHASKTRIKELLNFGKYSIGTVIGTNLLKSSDTLIIICMLGPSAIACYTVPYKVIEII